MNLKAITQPLADKVGDLKGLIADIETDMKEQIDLQKKIVEQLILTNQNLMEVIDKLDENKKGICKT